MGEKRMNILAIDTSGPACSVALTADGKLLGEIVMNSALTHSETVMPAVDELLSRENLTCADIDRFVSVAGPGSFTGVRIGVCVVKALAHAVNKPCVRINSLHALAVGAWGVDGIICPILDARREQVYCAAYEFMGDALPVRVLPDAAIPLKDFLSQLPADRPLYFTGDGVAVHEKTIRETLGSRAHFAPTHARVLRASSACVIAEAPETELLAPAALTPIYLRAPQAERERSERLTRAKV